METFLKIEKEKCKHYKPENRYRLYGVNEHAVGLLQWVSKTVVE